MYVCARGKNCVLTLLPRWNSINKKEEILTTTTINHWKWFRAGHWPNWLVLKYLFYGLRHLSIGFLEYMHFHSPPNINSQLFLRLLSLIAWTISEQQIFFNWKLQLCCVCVSVFRSIRNSFIFKTYNSPCSINKWERHRCMCEPHELYFSFLWIKSEKETNWPLGA